MSTRHEVKYLLVGNSAGGIGAAEAIRNVDPRGAITIVSDEPYPAYSRPLISEYLAGTATLEKMLFRPPGFYEKNGIRTVLGTAVTKLDTRRHTADLADGATIAWDKLLLATGGTPIIPPTDGMKSTGVFSFTTLDDAKAISRYIKKGQRAVVIGGGLIGVSVTEALVRRGLRVTIVEMKDRILNTILDETASAMATEVLEKHEVKIITNHTVAEINSEFTTDRVHAVTLDDSRGLSCEAVIVAIGVRPRTDLAAETGLKINRGIVVDLAMRTSHPDVYACGDAAEAHDFIYGQNRVTPIWPTAYLGGRVAGLNMAGAVAEYHGGTAMNSIKYFGMSITSAGMSVPADPTCECVQSRKGDVYRKVILKDGRLTGLLYAGDIDASGIVYGLMKDRIDVSGFKDVLVKDGFGFLSLPEKLWRERLAGAFKKNESVAGVGKAEALR